MARTTIPPELVAVNAIQGTLIADNSVTAVHIATNAISGTLVADNAVTSTHIAQNQVTATQIAQNTITVGQIADSAVETAKINNDAVTQAKIADDAVGPDQLAANSVVSASIANGTIIEADMADNAVTLAKMASLARGKIIVGDSAGDPSALAIGSNGTVLKSDGTDVSWGTAGVAGISSSADATAITISSDEVVTFSKPITIDGHTSSVASIFEANGNGDTVPVQLKVKANNGTTSTQGLYGNAGSASTDNTIALGGSGTSGVIVDNGGKVGINTTPDTLLNLKDTGGIEVRLEADSNNNGQEDCFIRFYTDGKTQEGIAGMDNNNSSTLFSGNTENGMVFGTVSNLPTLFATNNTQRMIILNDGRVGINRTPAITNSKLEVGGADNVPLINVEASGETAGFGIGSNKLKVYYGTTEIGGWSSSGRFNSGNIYLNGESSNSQIEAGNVHFKVGAGIWMSGSSSLDLQLQVPVTGVGVSTAAKLDAPTGDWYTNDGTVSNLSDSRLKKEITTLSDGISIVKQLRPVTYKYDDTTVEDDGSKGLASASDTIRYGFVAQEVEAVASHYVTTREGKVKGETVSDLKSTSMTRMIPMLVKAIQELEAEVQALKG